MSEGNETHGGLMLKLPSQMEYSPPEEGGVVKLAELGKSIKGRLMDGGKDGKATCFHFKTTLDKIVVNLNRKFTEPKAKVFDEVHEWRKVKAKLPVEMGEMVTNADRLIHMSRCAFHEYNNYKELYYEGDDHGCVYNRPMHNLIHRLFGEWAWVVDPNAFGGF